MKLFSLLMLLLAASVRAWWEIPHMLTAEVARQTLLKDGRAPSYDAALDLVEVLAPYFPESQTFMSAAVWMDDIKGRPFYDKRFSIWHYVDFPYPVNVTTWDPTPEINALTQLPKIYDDLAGVAVFDELDNGRATAIRMLLHLMGDIHQPLHCVSRFTPLHDTPGQGGDRGGNLFVIDDEETSELHAFWDNAGDYFGLLNRTEEDKLRHVGTQLLADHPQSSFPTFVKDECNFTKFALESFEYAKTVVYQGLVENDADPPAITPDYRNKAQALAQKRVVLGGMRLAACIHTAVTTYGLPKTTKSVSMLTFVACVAVLSAFVVLFAVLYVGTLLRKRRDGPSGSATSQASWALFQEAPQSDVDASHLEVSLPATYNSPELSPSPGSSA